MFTDLKFRTCCIFVGILCSVFVVQTRANETKISSSQEVPRWQTYFRQIRSIQFNSLLTVKVSKEVKHAPPADLRLTMEFVADGNKFFTDIVYPKGSPFWRFLTAYDESEYQYLRLDANGVFLDASDTAPNFYYNGTEPLTQLFAFVFASSDAKTLTTLQGSEIWKRLAQRTGEWRVASQQEKTGHLLTVFSDANKQRATERYEVFVEQKSGLPLSWKRFSVSSNKIIAQLNVTQWVDLSDQGASIKFPVSMETKVLSDDTAQPINSVLNFHIIPNSIKFNQPVNEQIFILSEIQVASDVSG